MQPSPFERVFGIRIPGGLEATSSCVHGVTASISPTAIGAGLSPLKECASFSHSSQWRFLKPRRVVVPTAPLYAWITSDILGLRK